MTGLSRAVRQLGCLNRRPQRAVEPQGKPPVGASLRSRGTTAVVVM